MIVFTLWKEVSEERYGVREEGWEMSENGWRRRGKKWRKTLLKQYFPLISDPAAWYCSFNQSFPQTLSHLHHLCGSTLNSQKAWSWAVERRFLGSERAPKKHILISRNWPFKVKYKWCIYSLIIIFKYLQQKRTVSTVLYNVYNQSMKYFELQYCSMPRIKNLFPILMYMLLILNFYCSL